MTLDNLRRTLVVLFYALALFLPLSFEYKFSNNLEITLFSEPIMALITLLIPIYFFGRVGFKRLILLDKLVLVYIASILIVSVFSVNKVTSLKYFITVCWFTASGYFLPRFVQLTRNEWKKVVFFFVIGVAGLSGYVLYQHTQLGIFNQSSYMVARPFIYQGHTNLTAIIEPSLLVILCLLYYKLPKRYSFVTYLLFISFIFIIDFSCSRASFVTTLLSLCAFFLLLPMRRKVVFALLVVGTIMGSYLLRYANDYYHENYVRQPLKPYDPEDRTTWKGTTTYSVPIDDEEVIKYRQEHDGKLVYEDAVPESNADTPPTPAIEQQEKTPVAEPKQVPQKKEEKSNETQKKEVEVQEITATPVPVPTPTPAPEPKPATPVDKTPQETKENPVVAEKKQPSPEKPVVQKEPTAIEQEKVVVQEPPITEPTAQVPAPEPTAEPEEKPAEPLQEVVIEGKTTDEVFALTTEERQNMAPISQTNKELDILNFDDNHSNVERMNRWKAGIYFFKENPITGIGPGTFSDHYLTDYYGKGLVEQPTVVSSKKMNIHNLYLAWITEGGILLGIAGLLIVLLCLKIQLSRLLSFGLSFKGIMKYYRNLKMIKGILLIYFATFLLHAVVQDFSNEPRVIIIFWVAVSLLQYYKAPKRSLKPAS